MKRVEFRVDGDRVRGLLHEPPGAKRRNVPLVVAAHGLASSRVEWYGVPEQIAKAGYGVLSIDFRGHGESEGERGVQSLERATADLHGAVEAVRNEYGLDANNVALLGHSLGATLCLGASPALKPRCVVALAPVRRTRDEMAAAEFVGYNAARIVNAPLLLFNRRGLRVPYKVDYRRLYEDADAVERARRDRFLQRTIPVKNYQALVHDLDGERFARHVKAPTLVVLAGKDKVVQNASSHAVYEALAGPKELVVLEGSGHSMPGDFRSDDLVAHCVRFLGEHLRG